MKIYLSDPKIELALDLLRSKHPSVSDFSKLFEEHYNCKIYSDDPFCLDYSQSYIILEEGKFKTWFQLL